MSLAAWRWLDAATWIGEGVIVRQQGSVIQVGVVDTPDGIPPVDSSERIDTELWVWDWSTHRWILAWRNGHGRMEHAGYGPQSAWYRWAVYLTERQWQLQALGYWTLRVFKTLSPQFEPYWQWAQDHYQATPFDLWGTTRAIAWGGPIDQGYAWAAPTILERPWYGYDLRLHQPEELMYSSDQYIVLREKNPDLWRQRWIDRREGRYVI